MNQTLRLEGHISLEQVRRSPYIYLPFMVPPGTRRIHVAYAYSSPTSAPLGLGPGNTIDIGIFDSRGYEFLEAPGFRGWSGSARPEFFISPQEATPGYIRGPLFPGEWNVLLGAAKLEPEGARYEVTITLEVAAEDEEPAAEAERPVGGGASGPPRAKSGWLRGDLHSHTVHSDGLNTVEELARNAIEKGLDFLAVTDHNTNTHHEEIEALAPTLGGSITLIPGEEITTYWGHANTWGLREWVEFRCADDESMNAVQRYVRERGALISVNHPKCIGPPWLFKGWDGYQAMEVWQAPWRFHNWESLERWESLLQSGWQVVAVGGSDTHSIPPAPPQHRHGLGNPTTWVYTENDASEQSILQALRAGHVFISDAPDGPRLILSADEDGDGRFEKTMGDRIAASEGKRVNFRVQVEGGLDRRLWILCDGRPIDIVPLDRADTDFRFALEPSGRRYVRAELRGPRGRPERGEVIWAMTNPIWLS